jgi:hypothetical protein
MINQHAGLGRYSKIIKSLTGKAHGKNLYNSIKITIPLPSMNQNSEQFLIASARLKVASENERQRARLTEPWRYY